VYLVTLVDAGTQRDAVTVTLASHFADPNTHMSVVNVTYLSSSLSLSIILLALSLNLGHIDPLAVLGRGVSVDECVSVRQM